mgnify:CR=1 FL=1
MRRRPRNFDRSVSYSVRPGRSGSIETLWTAKTGFWLAARGRDPNPTLKFGLGLLQGGECVVVLGQDDLLHEHRPVRLQLAEKDLRHPAVHPAVEVDGRLFVDPNEDALKKILHVE